MPYRSTKELPSSVKDHLPQEAQRQFLRVVNSALARGYNEKRAFKQAWGVIKRRWKKDKKTGKWVKMSDQYYIPFAEREDGWYLYFPLGSVWQHRRKISFTEDDAREMVSNFKDNDVPGYDLPINILHRDEHGVYGYIADLRFANGEVQWKPHWRPEKAEEVQDKGYKYASPEIWFEDYQARDGKSYDNVALGMALTPRPRLGRATAIFSDETGEWEEFGHTTAEGNWAPDVQDFLYQIERINGTLSTLRSMEQADELKTDARNAIEALKKIAHKLVEAFAEPDTEQFADQEKARKAQRARSKRYGIAILPQGHLTKPGKWSSLNDTQFGDPVNYRYPIHDAAHARNAASRFAQEDNKNYRGRNVIARRIEAAKKKFKVGKFRKEDKMSEGLMSEEQVESLSESLVERISKLFKSDPAPQQPENDLGEQIEALRQEFTEKLAEKDEQVQTLTQSLEAETEAKKTAEAEAQKFAEKFEAEEQARRLAEFTEKAKALKVPVKAEEFAESLMLFYNADGSEDKARYNQLVAVIEAMGNAEKAAKLFAEHGTDAVGSDLISKFNAAIKERMKEANEDELAAMEWVASNMPELYKEYDAATTQSIGSGSAVPTV